MCGDQVWVVEPSTIPPLRNTQWERTGPMLAERTSVQIQAPMFPQLYTVERTLKETYDTFTMELEPVSSRISSFEPGQFNMLYVFGVGEVPISICGDPARPEVLVHTTRAVGTVTQA